MSEVINLLGTWEGIGYGYIKSEKNGENKLWPTLKNKNGFTNDTHVVEVFFQEGRNIKAYIYDKDNSETDKSIAGGIISYDNKTVNLVDLHGTLRWNMIDNETFEYLFTHVSPANQCSIYTAVLKKNNYTTIKILNVN
jgi:hypothetical protein